MKCPSCGCENPSGISLCGYCGGKMQADAGGPLNKACPECGAQNPLGGLVCFSCGAKLKQESLTASTLPKRPWRWAIAILGLFLLVSAAIGGYYYWPRKTAPLESLLPESAAYPLVATADGVWWWDNLKGIRQEPFIREVLAGAEEEAGLSFENDVLPWVGQVGAAVLSPDESRPQIAIYAQVRNHPAFLRRLKHLRSAAAQHADPQGLEGSYKGVPLLRMEMRPLSGSPVPVTACQIKGWVILGIGDGAVEKVIDVWKGQEPSLRQNSSWAQVISRLPRRTIAWFGIRGTEWIGSLSPAMPSLRGIPPVAFSQSVAVCSLSEEPDGFRIDVVGAAGSEEARAFWREMKSRIHPVEGRLLERLSDRTISAAMLNNVSEWWKQAKSLIRESAKTPEERERMERDLAEMEPLESVLSRLTGECGVALVGQAEKGIGYLVLGEAGTEGQACQAAEELARFCREQGQKVSLQEDGSYILSVPHQHNPDFPLLPCWTVRGKWLIFSTHPDWLSSDFEVTGLKLPAEAKGADAVALGHFDFLEPLLDEMEHRSLSNEVRAILRKLRLDRAKWAAWLTTDPEGNWQHVILKLYGWHWRQAVQEGVQGESYRD